MLRAAVSSASPTCESRGWAGEAEQTGHAGMVRSHATPSGRPALARREKAAQRQLTMAPVFVDAVLSRGAPNAPFYFSHSSFPFVLFYIIYTGTKQPSPVFCANGRKQQRRHAATVYACTPASATPSEADIITPFQSGGGATGRPRSTAISRQAPPAMGSTL